MLCLRLFLFISFIVCLSAEALSCPDNEEEVGCLSCESYCIQGVLTKKVGGQRDTRLTSRILKIRREVLECFAILACMRSLFLLY